MASTYSSILRLELQANGEGDTTWGSRANTVFEMIEEAIAGRAAITHSDAASYTLTTNNSASDEARNAILSIGGALTAARNTVVPSKSKIYLAKNATTGGFATTLKTSAGTGVEIPNGKTTLVYSDGTNVQSALDWLAALTVAGALTVGGALAVSDSNFSITGSSDATKIAKFEVDGFTTATTRTFTLPDASDTVVGLAATQTLTNKTLTSPALNTAAAGGAWTAGSTWTLPAFTLGGTVTSNGQSFTGTIANLGTVTTVDINGGTIDGAAIGGATPAAGAFTTLSTSGAATLASGSSTGSFTANTFASSGATLTGGTINGMAIGGSTPAAGAFTTLSTTGNVTLGDDVGDVHAVNGGLTHTIAAASRGYKLKSAAGDLLALYTGNAGNGAEVQVYNNGETDYEPLLLVAEYVATYARTGVLTPSEITRVTSTGLGVFCTPSYGFDVTKSSAGSLITARVANLDNTNAASSARLVLQVGGGTAGDQYVLFSANGWSEWAVGQHASADSFKVSKNATLGTNDYLTIDTSGNVSLTGGSNGRHVVVGGASSSTYIYGNTASTANFPNTDFGGALLGWNVSAGDGETFLLASKGAGTSGHITFGQWDGTSVVEQVRVAYTAGATRYITLTGSNGGNPTIGTSAGSLAISSAVAMASTLAVTGIATFTAAPVFSSGTASQTMELTAGKALTTVAITGTGNYVKATSPTLTTPTLGVATATSINKVAITAPASSATLTLADGSSLVTSGANSITLTSSGATNVTLPTSGTLAATTGANAAQEVICIAISDETTAITTGTAKVTFRMPYAFTLSAVRASLSTASSSGTPTFDINEAGTTILSTKLTIDANEKTSTTAATAAVISDTALADDAEITIDIDTAGTGAKGAKIYLIGRKA